jgi:DNA-directed RNA polymerase subunit N (RpoN/RPB10)
MPLQAMTTGLFMGAHLDVSGILSDIMVFLRGFLQTNLENSNDSILNAFPIYLCWINEKNKVLQRAPESLECDDNGVQTRCCRRWSAQLALPLLDLSLIFHHFRSHLPIYLCWVNEKNQVLQRAPESLECDDDGVQTRCCRRWSACTAGAAPARPLTDIPPFPTCLPPETTHV